MVSTVERLKELGGRSPDLNLTEAAGCVGVTREYVRQIANRYNLPFRRGPHPKPRPICDLCGRETRLPHNQRHMSCIQQLARSPQQQAHRKAVAAECHRRWVGANRERWNASMRDYRKAHPAECAAYHARWRAKNPDKMVQYRITTAARLLERSGYTVIQGDGKGT